MNFQFKCIIEKLKELKKLIIKNLKAIVFRKGVGNKVTKDKVSMFVLL
jgi:CRISPR/Cas system CMR subunit Cmr6 (Cas7 group RAMP superfamily)